MFRVVRCKDSMISGTWPDSRPISPYRVLRFVFFSFLCLFFINSMLLLRCKIIINLIPTKVCTYYLLSYWIWNHWFIQLIPSNDQHIKVNLQSKYRLNFEDFNNLYERLLSLMANNLILMYDNTKVAPKLQHRIKII